jgi:uncharacterized membrane protein
VAGALIWNKLPDKLSIHWNMEGEVDGYASKAFAVIVMPLIFLGIHWLTAFAISADPKKSNHSDKMIHLSFSIVPALSVILSAITYAVGIGMDILVNAIVPMILGFTFVLIGNYLPKCKQNYTIGIKIPWTLNSEENWNKTHRLAGWVWVIGGIIMIPLAPLCGIWVLLPVILIISIAPIVYSFILHKKGI